MNNNSRQIYNKKRIENIVKISNYKNKTLIIMLYKNKVILYNIDE